MRGIFVLLSVLLILPTVSAVGILVPERFLDDDRITVRVGDEETIDFTLRGDSNPHDVEFFISVQGPGNAISFNGVRRYVETTYLEEYEEYTISVDIEGLRELEWTEVNYGFKYMDDSGDGLSLEQVVANVFEVRVVCTNCDNDDDDGVDVYVDATDSSSSGSGGGSGGGGGGGGSSSLSTFNNSYEESAESDVAPISDEDADDTDVQISAITSDGNSALSEATVPLGFATTNSQKSGGSSADENASDGKGALLLVIFLLIAMMVVNIAAVSVIKREDK